MLTDLGGNSTNQRCDKCKKIRLNREAANKGIFLVAGPLPPY